MTMNDYTHRRSVAAFPRLPLEANLDLTYRCNNDCIHCWLRLPPDLPEGEAELTSEEIRRIVEDARAMGCRSWAISGGEPMLREDFVEILEYVLGRSASYALNTNGTLITPRIAGLMRKPGFKMIALYGATPEVHDGITRNPGSFEAFLRGVSYLREAGAGFIVQVVPMKDNYGQLERMIRLAESLSPVWKLGATWLRLSAAGDSVKNREIEGQRLAPAEAAALMSRGVPDEPQPISGTCAAKASPMDSTPLLSPCFETRRDFHIDAHGRMSFCAYVKDPKLRIDLRTTSFRDAWEKDLPESALIYQPGPEYRGGCGACVQREDCDWCPVYAYLEHGRPEARIEYLCAVAGEKNKLRLPG
jgi:MoaA/NifB/PqqE/SkfB family radical SAM enzyme